MPPGEAPDPSSPGGIKAAPLVPQGGVASARGGRDAALVQAQDTEQGTRTTVVASDPKPSPG